MSERLPYEEQLQQQWNDLPLPDENMAWADMKRRLEEEDDDKVIAWWRRGCMLWGLLLLLVVATGWWLLEPHKWFATRNVSKEQNTMQVQAGAEKTSTLASQPGETKTVMGNPSAGGQLNTDQITKSDTNKRTREISQSNKGDASLIKQDAEASTDFTVVPVKRKIPTRVTAKGELTTSNRQTGSKNPNLLTIVERPNKAKLKRNGILPAQVDSNAVINKKVEGNNDTATMLVKADTIIVDSLSNVVKKKDTVTKLPLNAISKKDSVKKKPVFFFSAGIAIQRQIALDSQEATPYNASGRKGTWRDYIPSVYLRWNKKDKWFVQMEFKYGAPQYTRRFLYAQKTDSTPTNSTTTSAILRKTYYHQLPVSFNYYILENWSLGAGVVWNRFSSAVAEQTVTRRNAGTQVDSLVSWGIVKAKADSVFAKSYFQAMFETQYQWKRFSLGARYSFGLQPYIKFKLPGGTLQEEKNSSLQIFLRYQLWKSKEK